MKIGHTANFLLSFICLNLSLLPVHSQSTSNGSFEIPDDLSQVLPTDPKITIGEFENGFKYYIRVNKKPEQRAELRLFVNAGSVLEDDNQRGLAHFVEHMAFNGTKNFEKQEMVNYLESIGMRFGPDINAYTNFDETVYMLQIPTDSAAIVETAFRIFEDWAHNVSFDPEEIDKERGVVVEEWRLGRGANARLTDKQFPILFKDSRYAERLPIGLKEILEGAPYHILRKFYEEWYRPELMAFVAVGDFDKDWIEELIRQHFSRLPTLVSPRERILYPVPGHKEALFAIASDVEATGSNVSVYYKHELEDEQTFAAYRNLLVESLYNSMLNNRLDELLNSPDPPYLFGFSNEGRFIRSKEFYMLSAAVKDNGITRGLETLLVEANRVKKFGFTASELAREKLEMMRGIERAYNERDKTESDRYAAEYGRNFLVGEAIPGIEAEFELYKKFIPGITLADINGLADKWITEENRVVLVSVPEKDGVDVPTEKDLTAVFKMAELKDIKPYEDKVSDEPLVKVLPTPGKIVEEKKIEEIGVTEWTLSNGVRVVSKVTDFKNDEVVFTSFSPGGHSLIADAHFVAATTASALIREGGVGTFDQITLRKKLTGKIVSVSPWISVLDEGISGSASPQDLETMFQLIYLYFTAPRKDETAFLSFQSRIRGFIQNRNASPDAAFQDTLQSTMSGHHFRTRPWSEDILGEMNLSKSFRIYRDRFADASDFSFFFVGNFEYATLKPLVERYLGGLPSIGRKETWIDREIDAPKGVIEKEVVKGLEPKSRVTMIFTGPFEWNRKRNYVLSSMARAFGIKLREILREDKGGTYGVGIWSSTSRYPDEEYSINITFGCSPDRVEELTETVFVQIDSLRNFGLPESYLAKVKENQRRDRETNLKKNGYWLNALRGKYYHGEDPLEILRFDEQLELLTVDAVQTMARDYFNMKNYVKVVLLPEGS